MIFKCRGCFCENHFMNRNEIEPITNEELLSGIGIQEWNLRSFSEEIFENTNQLISLAKIQLAAINPEKKEETKKIIESSGQILSLVIKNLRSLAKQLSPADVIRKGFLSSLKYELERLNRLVPCKIDFKANGKPIKAGGIKEMVLFSITRHYILQALYIENTNQLEVFVNFSGPLIKIILFYPVNPELLTAKRMKKSSIGVLQRSARIGAFIITKKKNNCKEISICMNI